MSDAAKTSLKDARKQSVLGPSVARSTRHQPALHENDMGYVLQMPGCTLPPGLDNELRREVGLDRHWSVHPGISHWDPKLRTFVSRSQDPNLGTQATMRFAPYYRNRFELPEHASTRDRLLCFRFVLQMLDAEI